MIFLLILINKKNYKRKKNYFYTNPFMIYFEFLIIYIMKVKLL